MNGSMFIGTWWALVPPLLAILLAFVTKEVYSSLFIGSAVGVLLYTGFHPWDAFTSFFEILRNSMNINILIFDILLGMVVVLMAKSGGSAAYGKWAGTKIKTKRSALLATMGLGVLIESLFAILFIVFHNYLPHLFLNTADVSQLADNNEIIMITAKLLLVAAVFQISDGIQVVVLGALRGLQDVKIPMYITFVAYWIVGFPVSFYLGKYTDLEAVGIWIGLLAGLTAAAIFLYIRFSRLTKKLVLLNTAE